MCQLVIGHYLAEKGSNRIEIANGRLLLFLQVQEMEIFSLHKLSMQENPRDVFLLRSNSQTHTENHWANEKTT